MFEDYSDRTEAPTPRRREQFRREGNIARSDNLSAATVLIAALLLLSAIGSRPAATLESLIRQSLSSPLDSTSPSKLLSADANSALLALVPLLLTVFAVAVLINLAQIGFPLALRFPRRGTKRQSNASPTRFFGGLLKIILIGALAFDLIASRLPTIIVAGQSDFPRFLTLCSQTLLSCAMRLALLLLIFGVIDYAIQRYRLHKQLKMTRREREDELRQTEGDPKLRAHRKKLRQSSMTRSFNRQSP